MNAPNQPTVGKRQWRALMVEDRDDDLLLPLHELERAGYASRKKPTAAERCAVPRDARFAWPEELQRT